MFELKNLLTFLMLTVPIASHANSNKVTSTSLLPSGIIAAGYLQHLWKPSVAKQYQRNRLMHSYKLSSVFQ